MTEETPDITPKAQIKELRDQQSNTMLTVLSTLSNIPGITIKDAVWPCLDPEENQQRHCAAVSFWVP